MGQIKVATWNVEWMYSLFGAKSPWVPPVIVNSFPGTVLGGGLRLEAISDVPELCRRIAGVIQDMNAQIIGIVEAPKLKTQMELFVKEYLNNDYEVHHANDRPQSISALVHKSIANKVTSWQVNLPTLPSPWNQIYCYPWGKIAPTARKSHYYFRKPLMLSFSPSPANSLGMMILHNKSKFSLLKTQAQWNGRGDNGPNDEAVLDALFERVKLSAEVIRLRKFLIEQFKLPNALASVMVMGDLNDGPFADLMEEEFLIHNILDELVGTILEPGLHFEHAMTPDTLKTAATTHFPDPLQGGAMVDEIIDHILVSPAIWQKTGHFRVKTDSCQVETQIYDNHNNDNDANPKRQKRPSDHRPVSVVIDY